MYRPKMQDCFHRLLLCLSCYDTMYIVCGGVNYTSRQAIPVYIVRKRLEFHQFIYSVLVNMYNMITVRTILYTLVGLTTIMG